ncbi:Sirohydrochlorin cobaltochelatase [Acidipropionibacterium virtanenii]|uniref:precorrin-2 dehydrogenase n=2 Tax=Acidipropionibacterium virtanenii TaxID=2057246 RepID=A0A344UWD8_9ACTN|nr:CbiX/SirB N-terminal domain-containing protein [Acidipropionibacterium virtanenii]AXE39586.1 Sirohydrochlorin cobaltochelatase [Acidipropionibacterium virtanenii]
MTDRTADDRATAQDFTSRVPLVIAAHGTRNADGVETCRALARRVASKLPGVPVELGFVELAEPPIADAVATAVAAGQEYDGQAAAEVQREGGPVPPDAVVVPLMINTGGHVQRDIPEAIDEGRGDARVLYSSPLQPDPRLRAALGRRLHEAMAPADGREWEAKDTAAVLVGRGALDPEANAAHYQLTRLFWEENKLKRVQPCFIQVTPPSLPEALSLLSSEGATQIVVVGNFLFPGRLHEWMTDQVRAWNEARPDVEVRVAEVIGDCDELADVVVDRYRSPLGEEGVGEGAPVYLSGLRLAGRDVLVVGAGHVAERRVVRLLDAGAKVHVVAPNAGIQLGRLARRGQVEYRKKAFESSDLDGMWFVQALTNDPEVNARVSEEAEKRRIFCVRGDAGRKGTAFTPATQQSGGMTVSVVGDRTPRRSAKLRDELLRALQG